MMSIRCFAKVVTSFVGLHRYEGAPDEVAFLRNLHRHNFHVTVWLEQFHDNRDIEYFMFKAWLDTQLTQFPSEEVASCERMAAALGELVRETYPGRAIRIEVNEDKENGAFIDMPNIVSIRSEDGAYLAGVIDGDGSIYGHTTGTNYDSVAVAVDMVKPDVPAWLVQKFGGTLNESKNTGGRYTDGKVHTLFSWRVHGSLCKPVLEAALPYLVLKRDQCAVALAICALILPRGGHQRLSDRDLVLRSKLAVKLKTMNT